MAPSPIADRFVSSADGAWRDLATGSLVHLDITPLAHDWREREQMLRERMSRPDGADVLVDFGRVGTHAWFEARLAGGGAAGRVDHALIEAVTRAGIGPMAGPEIVEGPSAPGIDSRTTARALAMRLRAMGYVTVWIGTEIPEAVRADLEHRHLCLLVSSDTSPSEAARWIRRLAMVSARGHLLVRLAPRAPTTWARERAPDWCAMKKAGWRDPRARRAAALAERGRYAGAGRWYRAALASARRRGDDRALADSCRDLVDLLRERDDWNEAAVVAREAMTALGEAETWADVAVVLAGVLVGRAEVAAAEAMLRASLADAFVRGASPPPGIAAATAELRFWQGRLDDPALTTRGGPQTSRARLIASAAAWMQGDAGRLARGCGGEAEAFGHAASMATSVAALLGACLEANDARAALLADVVARQASLAGSRSSGRLGVLFGALALAGRGLPAAERLAAVAGPFARAPALDRLLFAWLRASSTHDLVGERAARAGLRRAGVRLTEAWRWGPSRMHLLHSIPQILQLVHDAEDELAALVAACGWTRRHAGVDAVAFLDEEHAVVAGEGWTRCDTADVEAAAGCDEPSPARAGGTMIVARVRYAGVRAGLVAARGAADCIAASRDAIETVAALCAPALRSRIDAAAAARGSQSLTPEILGRSPAIVGLREAIARAAATPFAVLVEGESGTGKELVARAIHRLSPRRDRRFTAVNCAALADDLVEAELFGHARGAFTGAIGPRAGLFEDAHGGTLFLDEVSELSPRAQAKLLRVLQEREVRRVGENSPRPVDVRVVAATNRPLAAAVERAGFREDLLFRLAVVRLRLPPLRERIEDVPLIALSFWRSLVVQAGKRAVLGPDVLARLCAHRWPGNVRELQNATAALAVLAPARGRVAARLVAQVIGSAGSEAGVALPLDQVRADCERATVARALARHAGRRAPAARELGLTRQGLTKAIKRLGLSVGREPGVA
jgi:DNA-binding NtrC family response regulator